VKKKHQFQVLKVQLLKDNVNLFERNKTPTAQHLMISLHT